jgi:hypothetical protein
MIIKKRSRNLSTGDWRILNLDVDHVFYDTTSVHFEIEEEDEKLRKRGYSKNGRSDAPQMIVGMAVTQDGFPVKSWVFPGNTTDVTTIEQVKNDLKGWRLNRCIFMADAGMVSADNPACLRRGGGRYIVAKPPGGRGRKRMRRRPIPAVGKVLDIYRPVSGSPRKPPSQLAAQSGLHPRARTP